MQKTLLIVAVAILVLVGGVFLVREKIITQIVPQNQVKEEDKATDEHQVFVTNVDPDVSHWQTKETEFFTIKFPKEWYWLESDLKKTGYRSEVITNNPNFEIDKHADIGIFSGIGPTSPINLVDTEIVITNRRSPTSNAGTPSDALDSIFKLAKYNFPAVQCTSAGNLKSLPIVAHCSAHYTEDQTQLSYYVIDKDWSLTITLLKRGDSDALQPIVEKIARSIKTKY